MMSSAITPDLQQQKQQQKVQTPQQQQQQPTLDDRNTFSRRRSSSIISRLQPESVEERSDQTSFQNMNATWVNAKGAWIIHVVIIALLKVVYGLFPVSQELSWTLTNMTYVIGSYIMFHYVTGIPFEIYAGNFDKLTMWEQIDDGDQYTPAKKFLLGVPIGLFLVSTHYSRYDLNMFILNCLACLAVVIPKLPSSHRLRIMVPPSDE